ncbi:endonuclease/exonuclease/phosphatase family protein [Lihuaxuella thermophila]|uniref:Metal-dependent hydrolase, endonuclease/exonuclease/phosphatase family n=1 Tax=Lihuaxuella thermophila TaxID=1173111 RepID=A0A1H8FU15_9BACL|nr:endonuclease/exonuclease/phosphatase family protein [Lihuaxuella thermophila]SEN35172.1 Metal-dependent hydrolase, endonuclease/exonuclease/phosphatase family [Lihuaxuella thermophila]
MKKFILPVLLALAAAWPIFLSPRMAGASDQGHHVTLRVMSYNIHYGAGMDQVYNLDRIASVIRESKADIVGLQEVDVHWGSRSRFEDGIRILAEKLDMNYYFAPIYSLAPVQEGEPRREYGVGVLSKYPIIHAVNHEITRLSTQEPNPSPEPAPGFPEVWINAKGIRLPVYVTHLDYRSDPAVREMQVRDMLNIIARNHREKILLGDLNATPDAPELAPLFAKFINASAIGSQPVYTFPADVPVKQIDYVLTTPNIRVVAAHVPETLASDHRPVIADVMLSRGRQH